MKITNITKSFNKFSLCIDSLELKPGLIHGLIGHNGCGKTTVMKIIAGLIEVCGGEIDYEGLTCRDITMAPRKPYFLHTSVYRNLIYPLTIRGIKPNKSMVDYYLEISGLKDKRKQYALSLSSGEQQKLSLVRALIFSPKLILIDEALSNLDIESVDLFEKLFLERQKNEPATWLVISHQLPHIQRLCSRVFFMYDGAIEAEGLTEDILLRPINPRLKKYLHHELINSKQEVHDEVFAC